jgi:hypothetical protein
MPTTTEKYVLSATPTTLIAGTALNALASNGLVLGSAVNNVQGGGGGDGQPMMRLVVAWKYAVAPAVNSGIAVWFVRSTDGPTGSTFEDGSTTLTPSRSPDVFISAYADANAHSQARDVVAPVGHFKALWKNDATAQALAATNTDSSLSCYFYTRQGV